MSRPLKISNLAQVLKSTTLQTYSCVKKKFTLISFRTIDLQITNER